MGISSRGIRPIGDPGTMTLQFSVKGMFFDRQKVKNAVDRSARVPLNRIGSAIRLTARRSIRKARRKKIGELNRYQLRRYRMFAAIAKRKGGPKPKRPFAGSKPGEPPRSRKGILRRNIYYAYDSFRTSVVIGPARIARFRHLDNSPEILEKGGTATIKVGPKRNKTRKVRIAPRPYMKPALKKNQPKIRGLLTAFVRPYG